MSAPLHVACAGCRRLKVAGVWTRAILAYGRIWSHGTCPDCKARLYPGLKRRAA